MGLRWNYPQGKQYDLQPTRGYHSIMFIHDSLDTEAFQYLLKHCDNLFFFTCPQTLAGPLPPVGHTIIGSSSPLGMTVSLYNAIN